LTWCYIPENKNHYGYESFQPYKFKAKKKKGFTGKKMPLFQAKFMAIKWMHS
jgi:hypothetical protein